jgi:hypothetical protein
MAFRLALRPIAPFLILLALAARLLVPAGFMPMAGADGISRLIPCSGTGPIAPAIHHGEHQHGATMHKAGKQSPDHRGMAEGDHACPFAAVGQALAFASAPLDPPVSIILFVSIGTARAVSAAPGLGLVAPPPPKTGPPFLG